MPSGPRLQVITAVSDEPAPDHDIMHGTIPELAAQGHLGRPGRLHQRPRSHDRQDGTVLWERGAPDRLIHYDLDPRASQGL
jgi:hypothetical protein